MSRQCQTGKYDGQGILIVSYENVVFIALLVGWLFLGGNCYFKP